MTNGTIKVKSGTSGREYELDASDVKVLWKAPNSLPDQIPRLIKDRLKKFDESLYKDFDKITMRMLGKMVVNRGLKATEEVEAITSKAAMQELVPYVGTPVEMGGVNPLLDGVAPSEAGDKRDEGAVTDTGDVAVDPVETASHAGASQARFPVDDGKDKPLETINNDRNWDDMSELIGHRVLNPRVKSILAFNKLTTVKALRGAKIQKLLNYSGTTPSDDEQLGDLITEASLLSPKEMRVRALKAQLEISASSVGTSFLSDLDLPYISTVRNGLDKSWSGDDFEFSKAVSCGASKPLYIVLDLAPRVAFALGLLHVDEMDVLSRTIKEWCSDNASGGDRKIGQGTAKDALDKVTSAFFRERRLHSTAALARHSLPATESFIFCVTAKLGQQVPFLANKSPSGAKVQQSSSSQSPGSAVSQTHQQWMQSDPRGQRKRGNGKGKNGKGRGKHGWNQKGNGGWNNNFPHFGYGPAAWGAPNQNYFGNGGNQFGNPYGSFGGFPPGPFPTPFPQQPFTPWKPYQQSNRSNGQQQADQAASGIKK